MLGVQLFIHHAGRLLASGLSTKYKISLECEKGFARTEEEVQIFRFQKTRAKKNITRVDFFGFRISRLKYSPWASSFEMHLK